MICLIALVAFGILGIFSVKYRSLAKEAFSCVFRRITLRRCETGFDKRMKAKIIGKLMKESPKAAGIVHKHFEAISWAFTVLMIASIVLSVQGAYNYAVYGNCNGPHSNGLCIYNPQGWKAENGTKWSDRIYNPVGSPEISCGSEHCAKEGCTCGGREENCTAANNYAACNGNCTCNKNVCG